MKRTIIPIILAVCSILTGCDALLDNTKLSTSDQYVCVWLSSDRDAFVSYGRTGEEVNRNFADNDLSVARGVLGYKYSYVNFSRPEFPEGTEIVLAKLELYHGGKNEDGTTDDITLDVGVVRNEPWGRSTITWNNRPDRGGQPFAEVPLYLRSQAWSGTGDISGYVKEMFNNPSSNYGFEISLPNTGAAHVEKGFYSNNDFHRKQNDLGLSPRLVMKIKLPPGKTMNDIRLPFLPADHDFKRLPQPVTTVNLVQSGEFPQDWNVSPQR